MTHSRKTPQHVGAVGRIVAANVRRLRMVQGISQIKLSELLDERGRFIHSTSITRVEGFARAVDVDDLVALADVLGVSAAEMLSSFQCEVCGGGEA
jgi:transcriptional regulator with XRE-family HTH domain